MSSLSALLPSTQRPIPLKAREDLVVERIDYLGIGYWVMKEPVGLKYYRLQPEQYHCLWLLDGTRNLEQIREALQKELPTVRLQLTDIQHLITDLHEKGLAVSNRPGQGPALLKHHRTQRRKKILGSLRSLLYIRLPGWDPETTLRFLYPLFRWLFSPWAVSLYAMVVLASWVLVAVQFDTFRSQLPEFQQFFGWPNLLYMWITLGIAKVIHEFGHGLSCKHFAGECHEIGIMLLVFSPCLYCDVSDSWMVKNKWKRIMIGGAGIYIEVLMSAVAVFVWWNTGEGLLHHLALNLFFVTTVTTVIWNANPLMRFDGYYMMADFLEIPNLRPKADRLMRESFAWYCLGIESRPDPFMPETGRVWFVMFAVAAWLYRWFILACITVFLYTVLKPVGLQSIGIGLAVVSISMILFNMGFNTYKLISAPRIEPMSRPKAAITVTVLVCLIVAVFAIPLPLHIEALFIVEPHGVQHVYVNTPGELTQRNVTPGQSVQEGEVLARLTNVDMENRRRQLIVEQRVQRVTIRAYEAIEDWAQMKSAEQRLETIDKQLADLEEQLEQLTISAPATGTIVAPPHIDEPDAQEARTMLGRWYGTPLDERNQGCFLEERTHLLSVAPDKDYQAVLLVDQGDRNDVFLGQAAELKFDPLPARTYEGKVEEFSDLPLEFVPQLLSNKLGGEVPTVTDAHGRERLQSVAYQAIILLTDDTSYLKTGMRGRARFDAPRSAAQWLWRYLRRTFHFRL